MNYNLAVIKGDGIGPEVVTEAMKVLDRIGEKFGHTFQYDQLLMGGCSIDAYGEPLTDETVAKAKQSGIMSIERCVEELYGDTLDEHCKQEEIARLKAEQGVQDLEEPSINMSMGGFMTQIETEEEASESSSKQSNLSNESKGV